MGVQVLLTSMSTTQPGTPAAASASIAACGSGRTLTTCANGSTRALWRQDKSALLTHAIYPTDYPATCHYCPAPSTLYHQVWECQKTPDLYPIPNPSIQQWTARLTSKDPTFQLDLVQRARAASRSQGIPD